MEFLNIFTKNEGSRDTVGSFNVPSEKLKDTLVSMMDRIGLVNPRKVTNSSNNAITIVKNDDGTYTITLRNVDPPITLTWTRPFSNEEMMQYIEQIATKKLAN
ncbi:MAG: hypothetical protein Q9M91_07340 [Candidatus Dojkabacteria bacterium]|nr:hypothetical protein [Candidatus Dojkabacteria bacterium]MDQ7021601.1 hypothetical protein [Candidatus Dojkabacteria bacterium]